MTRLPHDVSRCTGQFGLGHDSTICERREQCLRYLVLHTHPLRDHTPVSAGLCEDGDDFMIGVNG